MMFTGKNLDEDMNIFYPLRSIGSWQKFSWWLFVMPVGSAAFLLGIVLLLHCSKNIVPTLLMFAFILLVLLLLFWVPHYLAIPSWAPIGELVVLLFRNLLFMWILYLYLPYDFLERLNILPSDNFHRILLLGFMGFFIIIDLLHHSQSASHEVRSGVEPRHRRISERWVALDALMVIGVFIAITLIISSFVPTEYFSEGVSSLSPKIETITPQDDYSSLQAVYKAPNSSEKKDSIMEKNIILWISITCIISLLFFLTGILPYRVMKGALISVTFHERDVKGVLKNSHQYYAHFLMALILKHPLIMLGGVTFTFLILGVPIFLYHIVNANFSSDFLLNIFQADEIILALAIFFSWFAPMVLALVRIDETYGEYFNQRMANLLMSVQRHIVLIGFGSLGKRVLDRQIRLLLHASKWKRLFPGYEEKKSFTKKLKKEKSFFMIVTPDIQLELVCSEFVVIEKDPVDVIYSTQNELLGMYGAVSTANTMYKLQVNDAEGTIIHPGVRVLVPVVVGEAREPFINSRVNLERARLMISTIPDGETVQAVFERAIKSKIRSIVCVRHSDQISYLTYRSRHHPVVLVYPRHNQGNTLGYRMWATMLKVRTIEKMRGNKWPNVLILGNNKANRFMIETLWTFLPGSHVQRMKLVQHHFTFIVTPGVESIGYPILKEIHQKGNGFDLYWPESFITSGRFPYPVPKTRNLTKLELRTRMINDVDTRALIECIWEHKPDIILISHDEVDSAARMVLRCMRAIERLSNKIKNFHMPIILLSSAQADEREHLVLGDASRYYDAICRLYGQKLVMDHRYPGHSRYDHYMREVIGETISDSLADAEEMIIGAIKAFQEPETVKFWQLFTRKNGKPFNVNFITLPSKNFEKFIKQLKEQISRSMVNFSKDKFPQYLAKELTLRVFENKEHLEKSLKSFLKEYLILSSAEYGVGATSILTKGEDVPRQEEGSAVQDAETKSSINDVDTLVKKIIQVYDEFKSGKKINPFEGAFVEVSGCLPNRPGTLADYLSKLAGLETESTCWEQLSSKWKKNMEKLELFLKNNGATHNLLTESSEVMLPSFQYLRNLKLDDPSRSSFALTGYATLVKIDENYPMFKGNGEEKSLAVRLFANNGKNYLERLVDPIEDNESPGIRQWRMIQGLNMEPFPPGVPEVINRIMNRNSGEWNTIEEYKKILFGHFGPFEGKEKSPLLCPGMNNCRIAAFQDYINASNNLRFDDSLKERGTTQKLWHARNYFCSSNIEPAAESHLPTENSYYARIFCCAYAKYQPGLIASLLNGMLFRKPSGFKMPENSLLKDWQINIDYFKHITCQNKYYSVNRLFGNIVPLRESAAGGDEETKFPLLLLRIIPIGNVETALHWYTYAWVLWNFLNDNCKNNNENNTKEKDFQFSWIDERRVQHRFKREEEFKHPDFEGKQSFPISITIKVPKARHRGKGDETTSTKCRICGLVDKQNDCRRFRAWL